MSLKTILGMSLLLVLLGCSKVTLGNYNKITAGMSYEKVTGLIGQPAKCDDLMGLRNCTWGDDKQWVNVSFVGGKVLLFSSHNLK